MQIRQDPITGLWARSDGAICMPPTGHRFKKFRWTFGTRQPSGYLTIRYKGKHLYVHQIICRAFYGLPPADKPFCDHKNRIKSANFVSNLHWASCKENNDNADCVDNAVEKYGARYCENKKAYQKAYREAHREDLKAYDTGRAAKMKAQGLHYCKGPDGKFHWLPRVHKSEEI